MPLTRELDALNGRIEEHDRLIRALRVTQSRLAFGGGLRQSALGGTTPTSIGSPIGSETMWTNNSGGALNVGDVVVWDGNRLMDTTTAVASQDVIGIVMNATVAAAAEGRVRHSGYHPAVKTTGVVAVGDYLETSATAKRAQSQGSTPAVGAFAVALTASAGGSATVAAYVFDTLLSSGTGGAAGMIVPVLADGLSYTWVDQPAALTELFGMTTGRTRVDLTDASTIRLVVNVLAAGVAGAKLRAQYSTDLAAWNYFDGVSGPSVAVDAATVATSAFVSLAAGAKADVYVRVVGIDGDGAADPKFGLILLEIPAGAAGGSAPDDLVYILGAPSGSLPNSVAREWLKDNYDPDDYPSSPNALDDEFEGGGSIDGKWTKVNDPAGADALNQTDFGGYLHVGLLELGTDNYDNAVRLFQTPPTGTTTWEIVAKLSAAISADAYQADAGEFCGAMVYLADSANDLFVGIGVQFNDVSSDNRSYTLQAHVDNGAGGFSSPGSQQTPETGLPGEFVWVKLKKATASAYTSANTYDYYVSKNGMIWHHIATISKTFTAACDEVGLMFRRPKSQAGTPKGEALVDSFRKVA